MAYIVRAGARVSNRVLWKKTVAATCAACAGALVVAGLFPHVPGSISSTTGTGASAANTLDLVHVSRAERIAMDRVALGRASVPVTVPTTAPTPTAVPTASDRGAATSAFPPAPVPPVAATPATPARQPVDIPPSPDFVSSCSATSYDDSAGCVSTTVQAIDNARADEGLPGISLPGNWASLTPEEQLFVATDLERTVRGMAPLSAMASSLDQSAEQAAAVDQDPSPAPGFAYSIWGANWSGGFGNPLEAVYMWMYDDGEGSGNIECTPSNPSGCWRHRDNVLVAMSCTPCVMGVGFAPQAYRGGPSLSEILVNSSGSPAVDFTWAQEVPYL